MDTKRKLPKCHICNEGDCGEWSGDKRYWVCDKCGSLWMKNKVESKYDQDYYSRGKTGALTSMIDGFSFWDRYSTLGLKKNERILEIGFGEGKFLRGLRERGYKVWGVEQSEYARNRIKKVLGEHNVFDDIKRVSGKYEVVVMYHVLEHVDEPAKYLESIKKILTRNGRLVVRVPNVESWEAQLAGSQWYHLDYPNHRTLFGETGLIRLFERCGFENISSRNYFGEYRQVLGYSILSKLGLRPNKWVMIGYQIVTIPILWIFSVLVAQHGVIEVEGRIDSSKGST